MAGIMEDLTYWVDLKKLFENCIGAFDTIETTYNQSLDLVDLTIKLNIERCRLFTWGIALGLVPNGSSSEAKAPRPVQGLIRETLETLHRLFEDSQQLKDYYGCKQFLGLPGMIKEHASHVARLATAFNHFTTNNQQRSSRVERVDRARWAISNRKRFQVLIADVADNIDDLQTITEFIISPVTLDQDTCTKISNITDEDTLNMISEACKERYPDMSEVAAEKAQLISTMTMDRWKIEYWQYEGGESGDPNVNDGEDLSEIMAKAPGHIRGPDCHSQQAVTSNTEMVEANENVHLQSDSLDTTGSELPHPRIAKPLVIPLVVEAVGSANDDRSGTSQNSFAEEFSDSESVQFEGYIEECSVDGDTAYARSESSITVTGESVPSVVRETESARQQRRSNQRQGNVTATGQKERNYSMANGFMNFNIMNGTNVADGDDYFVLSFGVMQRGMRSQLNTGHGHTHYVNARSVARIVRTDVYVPFDLKSWPRDLQIYGFSNAVDMDGRWMRAMHESRFQVNVYAASLELPFCTARDGGCLQNLFRVLSDEQLVAKCTPTFTSSDKSQPEVFIMPIGRSTFMPQLILYNSPEFSPRIDVLLILLVFPRPSPNGGR